MSGVRAGSRAMIGGIILACRWWMWGVGMWVVRMATVGVVLEEALIGKVGVDLGWVVF